MSEPLPFLKIGPHFINLSQITRVLLTEDQLSIWLSGDDDKLSLTIETEGARDFIAALEAHSQQHRQTFER